jgi:hypothetical protein
MDTTTLPQRATDVSDEDIDFVAGEMNDGTVDRNGDHSHQREWELLRAEARRVIVGARAYEGLTERQAAPPPEEVPALQFTPLAELKAEGKKDATDEHLEPATPPSPPGTGDQNIGVAGPAVQVHDPAPDSYEAYLRQRQPQHTESVP